MVSRVKSVGLGCADVSCGACVLFLGLNDVLVCPSRDCITDDLALEGWQRCDVEDISVGDALACLDRLMI